MGRMPHKRSSFILSEIKTSVLSVGFHFCILDPGAADLSEALPRLFNAAEKAYIVFEPIVEPVDRGPEADQHTDRFG